MSADELRNPYVVLGVPFGCSRDDASAAFARRARGLRRSPEGATLLPNLTWALNQIDEAIRQPELALDVYRVPANPEALVPTGEGVMRPPAELLGRRTRQASDDLARFLEQSANEALAAIREDIAGRAELPAR
jgi:hypothetical protein